VGIGTLRETVELFEQRDKTRGGLYRAFSFPQQAIHGLFHRCGFVQTRSAGKPFDLVDHDRIGNLQGHDELHWGYQYDQYTSVADAAQNGRRTMTTEISADPIGPEGLPAIERVLASVRPAIEADGGIVQLAGTRGDTVILRLGGKCMAASSLAKRQSGAR
jgi:hypothetical protein